MTKASTNAGVVKLLTGNDVPRGDVLWWGPDGWTRALGEAVPVDAAEAEALIAAETAAERVNDLALVEAESAAGGGYRPLRIRERIRGFGPTVRPDLKVSDRDYR